MKCPNCAAENRPAAKFCENCGHPLARACPNCGEMVAPKSRFCGNCGFNLARTEPTQAVSLDELRRATPQLLAQKILAQREQIEGERKLVTALFADIVGSTALAEAMDPEDWREVVSGAHRRVSQAIYRYEGTIAQLLGDGVLAFFGAPLTHEDDAERAVRAALELLTEIRTYAGELRQRGSIPDLRMRVGLNTGTVVVGQIGSDLHMEYLAIGDTVNLAARMQSAADPDTVLISDNTYRHVTSLFEIEDRGRIVVKGKAEPVQVYEVAAERKGAARARGIAGLASPMVGRQREFSTLMQVIADLRTGKGGIVTIAGEAGLGKSRLIAEWRKAVRLEGDESPVRWVEGRCLSYGTAIGYHLGIDILRSLVSVSADASEEEIHTALGRSLDTCCGTAAEAQEIRTFLGHMLGLSLDEQAAARVRYLDGPALQSRYVAAFKSYLRALARMTPTVVVAEDIHWADPSSVELGLNILPIAADEPLVFVLATRPDPDSAGWRLVTEAREVPGVSAIEVHLSPLTEGDSQLLVSNLLEIAALPNPVRQMILAKAEGNPFYVEEVIRMLIDRGGLRRQDGAWVVSRDLGSMEIPDTLLGVIMARIDRLPEDAKRTLQIASVIGRRFQVRVLETVLRGVQ